MDAVTQEFTETDLDFPSLWGAKFINDDYTPMDFVIQILMENFGQNDFDAVAITIDVHKEGQAVVGSYTKDIAETKVMHAMRRAAHDGHPLRIEAVPV
jgi:ATP-dependent Clp protease adaptor protein ClpS